jgi:methionyl aminopeptidase
MSINHPEELECLCAAGVIARRVLEAMKAAVQPGITTRELDIIGARVMAEAGARSAPALVYDFPGANCISVNEEAVHGIPGDRALKDGDLLKLDVTVEKDGFMADSAETVPVGNITEESRRLLQCAERAFRKAMLVAVRDFRFEKLAALSIEKCVAMGSR